MPAELNFDSLNATAEKHKFTHVGLFFWKKTTWPTPDDRFKGNIFRRF